MSDKLQEKKSTSVPRITQLDANEFNQEICNVLSAELMKVSKHLKPGALNNVKYEINLVLHLLIFYYSVMTKNSTFGQELLGLKYKELLSNYQIAVYAFLNCILPYLKNKYDNYSCKIQNAVVINSVDKLEVFLKICNFFNTVLFLREGKYPTIVDRLLKLKYCSVNKRNQAVSYNYMTRELLWHGFMELLMYTLPLINYKAIRRKIRESFLFKPSEIKNEKSIMYDSEMKCVVCDDSPTLPCRISKYCSHLACYYCLKSNLLADEKFMCPECGETNTSKEKFRFLPE